MIIVGLRPRPGALAGSAGGVRRLGMVRDLLLLLLCSAFALLAPMGGRSASGDIGIDGEAR